jgi:3-oxoadipate enol-lactonase
LAALSRFISRPAIPSAPAAVVVGSPATGIAEERRAAALERLAQIEAAGMAFAVEDSMQNGYTRSFAPI